MPALQEPAEVGHLRSDIGWAPARRREHAIPLERRRSARADRLRVRDRRRAKREHDRTLARPRRSGGWRRSATPSGAIPLRTTESASGTRTKGVAIADRP